MPVRNVLIHILKQERLGRHGTFKSQALWSVRDGKGLITNSVSPVKKFTFSYAESSFCLLSLTSSLCPAMQPLDTERC
jgi:hypothetical protein